MLQVSKQAESKNAVMLCNERQNFDVLVDTGAEANIVKLGKLPRHLVYAAPKALKFVTASGQRLRGGDTCIDLNLEFMQEVDGKILPEVLRIRTTFFEADIRVDAILSYPWMAQNQLGVFPHLQAMALEKPRLTLLHGISRQKTPKGRQSHRRDEEVACKWVRLGEERKVARQETCTQKEWERTPSEDGEKPRVGEGNGSLKLAKLGLGVEDPDSADLTIFLDD